VDAEGPHVVSNEIFEPGPDRRARPAAPLRAQTQRELDRVGSGPFRMPAVGYRA
jgi:hypothetical protein